MGRGSEVKENKIIKEVKCDQPTDGRTKRVVESRARDLKEEDKEVEEEDEGHGYIFTLDNSDDGDTDDSHF